MNWALLWRLDLMSAFGSSPSLLHVWSTAFCLDTFLEQHVVCWNVKGFSHCAHGRRTASCVLLLQDTRNRAAQPSSAMPATSVP